MLEKVFQKTTFLARDPHPFLFLHRLAVAHFLQAPLSSVFPYSKRAVVMVSRNAQNNATAHAELSDVIIFMAVFVFVLSDATLPTACITLGQAQCTLTATSGMCMWTGLVQPNYPSCVVAPSKCVSVSKTGCTFKQTGMCSLNGIICVFKPAYCLFFAQAQCSSISMCAWDYTNQVCVQAPSLCRSQLFSNCSSPCFWSDPINGACYADLSQCPSFDRSSCPVPCFWNGTTCTLTESQCPSVLGASCALERTGGVCASTGLKCLAPSMRTCDSYSGAYCTAASTGVCSAISINIGCRIIPQKCSLPTTQSQCPSTVQGVRWGYPVVLSTNCFWNGTACKFSPSACILYSQRLCNLSYTASTCAWNGTYCLPVTPPTCIQFGSSQCTGHYRHLLLVGRQVSC